MILLKSWGWGWGWGEGVCVGVGVVGGGGVVVVGRWGAHCYSLLMDDNVDGLHLTFPVQSDISEAFANHPNHLLLELLHCHNSFGVHQYCQ